MRQDERTNRRTCQARRVFVTTRFDAPLDLQGVPYDTLSLHARDVTARRS